jgi:hypothetical protein
LIQSPLVSFFFILSFAQWDDDEEKTTTFKVCFQAVEENLPLFWVKQGSSDHICLSLSSGINF